MKPQGNAVRRMFSGIAGRYDLANHLLSMGIDYYWRKRLVKMVKACNPKQLCDLATGSGDVAFALCKGLDQDVKIMGLDFCEPMLEQANIKKSKSPKFSKIVFGVGDCLNLPLEDACVDVLTISFGLRNLENRQKGLKEMLRVLKPGGSLICLEFTQPAKLLRPFYYFYLNKVLPLVARIVTGDKAAYDYLAGSIGAFPNKRVLETEMMQAGFGRVTSTGLTGSIVALHKATKQ
jgi:demethylmenaquinone methyltransferase/2-methoxy-6-polyprenyl-1,4-benzoquinol methylase